MVWKRVYDASYVIKHYDATTCNETLYENKYDASHVIKNCMVTGYNATTCIET